MVNGDDVQRVVFAPDSNRLIVLVDRRPTRTPIGATVSLVGTEGTEVGKIVVTGVTDPFQDYDPINPPERGSHDVLVEVTVTNSGTRPLSVNPDQFYLLDTQGFLATQAIFYRTDITTHPDFPGGDLAPGAAMSGAVGYQLPTGTVLAAVLYTPNYFDQQVIVAELAAAGRSPITPTPGTTGRAAPVTGEAGNADHVGTRDDPVDLRDPH
jgi:hypothetical protein